jgi:cysteine desulfurase
MNPAIYLDHHATTPLAPEARAAMLPFLEAEYGNPSSAGHELGRRAARALEDAREAVAHAVGARRQDVVFTSGATESDNLAILGAARAQRARGDHVVTCATEHRAVLDACAQLAREGMRVTVLPVASNGVLDLARLEEALMPGTTLVSLMHGNNEIGVLHDLAAAAELCHRRGALLHSDATQALGRLPLDLQALGVDLLSITAHKAYGPKGVGALVARGGFDAVPLEPLFHGGGQERRLRPGTQNTIGIAGFAAACALIPARVAADAERAQRQARFLLAKLRALAPDLELHGDPVRRLPGNLNLRFPGLAARALMERLPELALSAGAACHSGSAHPSHVLEALGLDAEQARGAVRIGFGRTTTDADVETASACFARALRELRPLPTRA